MREIRGPLNTYAIFHSLSKVGKFDSPLHQNTSQALDHYRKGEWRESLFKIGIAAESLTNELCPRILSREEIPDSWEAKLIKLFYNKKKDMMSETARYIASLLLPIKWLRNQVSHPTEFKSSEEDAYVALLAFQISLEKYVSIGVFMP